MKKILIISPVHDIATILSYTAAKRLKKWIKEQRISINVVHLAGPLATRLSLWLNRDADAIFYFGHGLKDRVGDLFIRLIPILDTKNIHWFKDKIVYTMACFSFNELGQTAIRKGVKAYFGQSIRYFGFIPSMEQSYWNDWYDLVNEIPKQIILGNSTYSALQSYENLANDLFAKYLLNPNTNLKLLFQNALFMNLAGDRSAKL